MGGFAFHSAFPTPWARKLSLLQESCPFFCLRLPAAAFLGLAKGGFPSLSLPAFSSLKSSNLIKASPRTSKKEALPSPRSFRGMDGMAMAFSVMSSPSTPSPRVEAETRMPSSYTRSTASPSIFTSQLTSRSSALRAREVSSYQVLSSCLEKTSSRLSILEG